MEKCDYPVGLLTEDELSFAGNGVYGYSASSYLYAARESWSSSPLGFSGTYALVFRWLANSRDVGVNDSYVIRPVVSLVPETEISGGKRE